ncbi:MAG: hypothetical protein AAF789_10815 [Bacteroidota bacterium]
MNKQIFLFTCLILLTVLASAQDLETFNTERLSMNKAGMLVLGSWATLNLVSSPILASQATGSRKFFYQMNGYWNTVNFALAAFGYYSATTADPSAFSLSQSIAEQQSLEKILLFNAGLDIGYVATGFYLMERSSRNDSDRLKGFGQSLILQGSFLFAFDLGFYLVQQANCDQLLKFVDRLALSPTGFSMIWKI